MKCEVENEEEPVQQQCEFRNKEAIGELLFRQDLVKHGLGRKLEIGIGLRLDMETNEEDIKQVVRVE